MRSQPASLVPLYWETARYELMRNDPVLDAIIAAHPGRALSSRGDPFQTLMRSIVGQQISLAAADTVWCRLTAAVAPTPAAVAALGVERLAQCGLSQRKASYILDLAQHFLDGSIHVDRWPDMDDEAVIADLVQVRGIGRWTAEMFLMFNLLRPDVLPVADLGLQRAVSLHYCGGQFAGADLVRHVAEHWRPWRSVATWYLWRSLETQPVLY